MALKPITVTLIMLLIVVSIAIIYFNVKKINERFLIPPDVPEYDKNKIDENCMNYVNGVKGWRLDFGLPEATNDKERKYREEKIKRRAEIISLFTTMKFPVYSIFGQQYFYSDACVIPKTNMDTINIPEDTCILNGNFIKENEAGEILEGTEGLDYYKNKYGMSGIEYLEEYRKKYVIPDKVQIYTPGLFRSKTALNENEMTPNNGCIIPTTTPEEFFNTIDRIAGIRFFNDDNTIRLHEEDRFDLTKKKMLAIVDRDKNIELRIAAEQERDRVIIERDKALARIEELKIEISNAKAEIARLDAIIIDRNNTIAARDNTIIENNNEINKLRKEKEDEITEKNTLINEMRALVADYNKVDEQLRERIKNLIVVPIFYDGHNYTGTSTSFNLSPSEKTREIRELSKETDSRGDWRHRISAVMVPPGYRVNIFTNANMKGKKYVLNGSNPALPKAVRKSNSLRIERIKPDPIAENPAKVTVPDATILKIKYGF